MLAYSPQKPFSEYELPPRKSIGRDWYYGLKGLLSTQGWESTLIAGVESTTRDATVLAAVLATRSPSRLSLAASTSTTASAPTAITSCLTSASASTAATTTRATILFDGCVVLTLDDKEILFLLLLLFALLAARARHEVLIFWVALERGALWELLLATLIGFARCKTAAADSETLLRLLSQPLIVGLRFVLRLRRSRIILASWSIWAVAKCWVRAGGVWGEARLILGLGLCDGLACLFIRPLTRAGVLAPAFLGLLLVVAHTGAAVTIIAESSATTAGISTATTRAAAAVAALTVFTWF